MIQDLSSSQQLLGGYLHQDWHDEFASVDDAVAAMIAGEPPETREAAGRELRALVAGELDDARLRRRLTDEVGCYYDPASDGRSDREWLSSLADRLAG